MARASRSGPILDAAEKWKVNCLLEGGSVLSDNPLWVRENFDSLVVNFVQNPHEGASTFLDKLQVQLEPAPAAVKQLAAELLWVMYLILSEGSMKGVTKEKHIRRVWEWSGEPLPVDHPALGQVLSAGTNASGQAYKNLKWMEFRFFVIAMRDWFGLEHSNRQELLVSPWDFAEWLEAREYAPNRVFRHIILFLLFPDQFERIISRSHKRQIVERFNTEWAEELEVNYSDRLELDRAILGVRERLEAEADGKEVDFHEPPFWDVWNYRPDKEAESTDVVTVTDIEAARAKLESLFPDSDKRSFLLSIFADSIQHAHAVNGKSWGVKLDGRGLYLNAGTVRACALRDGDGIYKSSDGTPDLSSREYEYGPIVPVEFTPTGPNAGMFREWGSVSSMPGHMWIEVPYEVVRQEWDQLKGPVQLSMEAAAGKTKTQSRWASSHMQSAVAAIGQLLERDMPAPDYLDDIGKESTRSISEGTSEADPRNQVYSLKQCAEDLSFEEAELKSYVAAIQRKGQAVFYGPPGTGKTYVAERIGKHLIAGDDGFKELVQFHPAYAYEDFMQGIRPVTTDSGGLAYPTVDGRFVEFCKRAASRSGPCVLIIDEINRANLSSVIGEVMYLLEYRDRTIRLPSGEMFEVPSNVQIIGTMNTADRSIALVDHALRRRFAFISLPPNHDVLRKFHAETDYRVDALIELLERLNNDIDDPNYSVGISFFLVSDLPKHIEMIWKTEIEPYLEEYFFGQVDRVKGYRWAEIGGKLTSVDEDN